MRLDVKEIFGECVNILSNGGQAAVWSVSVSRAAISQGAVLYGIQEGFEVFNISASYPVRLQTEPTGLGSETVFVWKGCLASEVSKSAYIRFGEKKLTKKIERFTIHEKIEVG